MPDKSVAQKLLIKEGRTAVFINAPDNYAATLGRLPDSVRVLEAPGELVDVLQVFVLSRQELEEQLPRMKTAVKPQGIIWVTYYKGTSHHKTDINRDSINAYAKTLGMEGVAMISVDENWSALRLKIVTG